MKTRYNTQAASLPGGTPIMTSTSTRTVVGVFDDRTTAERVVEELANNGFDRGHIQVEAHDSYATDAARGNTGLSGSAHDNSGGGIGGFFRRLFGDDNREEYGRYSEAVAARPFGGVRYNG
jgi:hypothetical protein